MPIPKYHEIMLPLLKLYSDNQLHYRKDFLDTIINHFKLTESEKLETIKAGHSRIWDRIQWAIMYLKSAELLESPNRGFSKISQRGLDILKLNLTELNKEILLDLYPDLMQKKFWNPALRDSKTSNINTLEIDLETTPDESLQAILEQKESLVKAEILESIKGLSPRQFEFLVVKILLAMGYGTEEFSKTTSFTNDGGIDGIIQADELGFDKIYIQAKKYEGNVGRPDIQRFVGAMVGTNKGVFITTSDFASSVVEYLNSRQENVILINGEKLVDLMYRHNQGVTVIEKIELKRLDTDFFEEM